MTLKINIYKQFVVGKSLLTLVCLIFFFRFNRLFSGDPGGGVDDRRGDVDDGERYEVGNLKRSKTEEGDINRHVIYIEIKTDDNMRYNLIHFQVNI